MTVTAFGHLRVAGLVAETVNGAETVLTWDLALGLSQVPATSDGAKDLYNLDRIGVVQAGACRLAPLSP